MLVFGQCILLCPVDAVPRLKLFQILVFNAFPVRFLSGGSGSYIHMRCQDAVLLPFSHDSLHSLPPNLVHILFRISKLVYVETFTETSG